MKEKEKWEIRSLKLDYKLSIFKNLLLFVGSILLFVIIQQPESIVNRRNSEESINRERAKLILDKVINEDDPKKRLLAFDVIRSSYPDSEEEYFKTIEYLINEDRLLFSTNLITKIDDLKEEKKLLMNDSLLAKVDPLTRALKLDILNAQLELIKEITEVN